ncbi:hypothetical protein [Pseudoxanthomonas wuyuanensis]|uniref:Polymer-forming cytoskeletal protein n=1 Tax=Pseudoxanthomonas wuyuanensis TaxID=1073196 RepID=A0A286D9X1_9GAMM|nr:hypothetical protein [Pseudoxanthomonas wuyuanensis]KAF1719461.1 hypothetical protein CSC75_14905 [Pseudoxanthomonas wuyuanensis]SOD55434.1 hypothetical protein SAMN06296416_107112 [Pseudoxanthomonas wuyuanensis]
MMRSRTVLLLTLALAAVPAFGQTEISKVNGGIEAEAGQTYGDLDTVNGSIRIRDGAIVEDASTVNGSITVDNKAQTASLATVNGSIRLGSDVTVDGDIETVNGSIFVDRGGSVRGDVETVNGSIGLVATRLGGGIETVRGDITVGVDSQVKGGIAVKKSTGISFEKKRDPRIVIGPNAVVEGPLVFERPVKLYVHRSASIGPVTGATAQIFDSATAPKD